MSGMLLAIPMAGEARLPACARPEIVVRKGDGALDLYCAGQKTFTFPATFGANPVGPKEREGDERTPEGIYRIDSKRESKRFYRFLGVSYPNVDDLNRARAKGIKKPGGAIGIHGSDPRLAGLARAWIRLANAAGLQKLWGPTDGCIGLTNEDVDVLHALVPVGAKVTIQP